MLDFQHIDTLHYFNAESDYLLSPSSKFMSSDQLSARMLYPLKKFRIPFLSDELFSRSLADHSIINYSYGIWKALQK